MALPMDRAAALELLKTHTHTQSLIHHAISVEAAMRHFAEFYGEDVEYWGMVGLLHDLDYEALMRTFSVRFCPTAMVSAPMSSRKSRWKR